ncbi:hypothetical protein HCG51_00375 [Tolypothrix sp. PCC 7910]|uniref:hypothetical protein n=1 Tax=Tolypothrix sp. PCC 7910 TaxID=2099387 RepID=UPI00142798D8|nr:hypothetical protein [Tolypothrix sp. PCC 7910]QIR35355.1 hypothetical protein HCG51_00375 [Tolypothrix sp. PCC 7910]
MNAHKIEVVLTEDGTLTLQGLPFYAGDTVEVIILEAKTSDHQQKPQAYSDANLYPLHNTQPYCYDDPTEPVALEDWEVLQ